MKFQFGGHFGMIYFPRLYAFKLYSYTLMNIHVDILEVSFSFSRYFEQFEAFFMVLLLSLQLATDTD